MVLQDEATPGQTLPLSEPVDEQYEALCHRVIPAGVLLQQESGNDFTLIGQSAPTSGENLSVRLKVKQTQEKEFTLLLKILYELDILLVTNNFLTLLYTCEITEISLLFIFGHIIYYIAITMY